MNDPFWLTYEEIANLTDRQIAKHYFYPRDENGSLKEPEVEAVMPEQEREPTLEEQISLLYQAGRSFGVSEAELDKARAELEARYGKHSS